jgi:hypothetical protein
MYQRRKGIENIHRGKIHRKNIKDEMIEIVTEKIGACQDPFAENGSGVISMTDFRCMARR